MKIVGNWILLNVFCEEKVVLVYIKLKARLGPKSERQKASALLFQC